MEIDKILTSPIGTNTYIVYNSNRAFVVDPGGSSEEILSRIKDHGATLEAVLLTHAHFDHIMGVKKLQDNGARVYLHHDDVDKIGSFKSLAFAYKMNVDKFTVDYEITGDETINVCGLDIKVLCTPGHSNGGVCYILDNYIFCGDTVFFMSYGRVDFYDGDYKKIHDSIVNKLFKLKGDYKLLPGHGEPTELDFERKHNAILND